ncbi:MAG: S1 RNA-binding domain-containing protein, partial [Candidatus Kapaibacterium sp.]
MREIWAELTTKKNQGEGIDLDVVAVNRGGVVAQYKGVEVFVPVSHWSLDRHNNEGITSVSVGDTFQGHVLEITSFDTDARRVTATRRTLLRRDLMGSLEVGQRLHGRVASILDFGAFVDLGGIDGLVHASEISYDRTKHPSELLSKGDPVEVVIREIDREKKRIYLGMKELLPSPWEGVEDRFPVGSVQHGKVVGLGKNGAFIELEPGLEGFVRASELSWTKRINNPKEVLRKGTEVDVKVLDSSARKQRLSLSYRQAQDDPWPSIAEKFSVGSRW